jgi:hypothetical protein
MSDGLPGLAKWQRIGFLTSFPPFPAPGAGLLGPGGKLVFHFPGSTADQILRVALQADGRIDVTGVANLASSELAIAQIDANGTLDLSFATGGMVTLSPSGGSDQGVGIAVQNDGKILVLDSGYDANVAPYAGPASAIRASSLPRSFPIRSTATRSTPSIRSLSRLTRAPSTPPEKRSTPISRWRAITTIRRLMRPDRCNSRRKASR